MTQTPIASNLLSSDEGSPRLLATRCGRCDALSFPVQSGCARCGSEDLERFELPPRGKLWTWTSQEFLPKAPPYAGAETKETFVRWFVGYVELHEKLCVEGRLVGFDDRLPSIGEEVELVVLPFSTDDEGNEVMIYAFAPAGPAMEAGSD